MEFKARYSSLVISRIGIALAFLGIGVLDIASPVFNNGLLHYRFILFTLLSFANILMVYRYIYLNIINKPILVLNENYIYDAAADKKYYWGDIETIYKKRSYLFIRLKNPVDYFDKIHNPIRRFFCKSSYKPDTEKCYFFIDAETACANPDELLALIDDYRASTVKI